MILSLLESIISFMSFQIHLMILQLHWLGLHACEEDHQIEPTWELST